MGYSARLSKQQGAEVQLLPGLPSNAVFCRAFAGGARYNSGAETEVRPGERDA
jgi:hypothetical protein